MANENVSPAAFQEKNEAIIIFIVANVILTWFFFRGEYYQ